jgi:hypothetical protein
MLTFVLALMLNLPCPNGIVCDTGEVCDSENDCVPVCSEPGSQPRRETPCETLWDCPGDELCSAAHFCFLPRGADSCDTGRN